MPVSQTEPHVRPYRQWGATEDPSLNTQAKCYASVLAPSGVVISQAVNLGYENCTTLASGILPRAWMPTLRHLMQRDPPINSPKPPATRTWVTRLSRDEPKLAMQRMRPCLVDNLPRRVSRQRIVPSPLADPMLYNMQAGGNTCPAEPLGEAIRSQNVPRRLSRQCVSVPGDSMLVNLQAGGNSCPVEPLDEPRSLSKRPRCCDRSRNSVSVESMSNYCRLVVPLVLLGLWTTLIHS